MSRYRGRNRATKSENPKPHGLAVIVSKDSAPRVISPRPGAPRLHPDDLDRLTFAVLLAFTDPSEARRLAKIAKEAH